MLIRAAVPQDGPQLMQLAAQSETAAHWSEREYEALFAGDAPKRLALVAAEQEQPEMVLGFIIALCASADWEIENVVVERNRRRQGTGSQLLRELLSRAREQQAASLLLEVRESNIAARQMYTKMGFGEQGRRSRYYRDPEEDALLLRRLLTAKS